MSYYHIGRVLTCTTILSKSVLVCVIGYLKVAVWDVCILKIGFVKVLSCLWLA